MMNEFEYMFSDMDLGMDVLAAFVGIALIVGLIALIIGIVSYVLTAAGMYAIAKRRGINNAWMAWIPGVSSWILGSISDQYQYVVKGKVRYNRIILISLWGASVLLGGITSGSTELFMNGTSSILGLLGGGFVTSMVSIALAVFHFIALYDLYCSCNPQNSVLFLVLSIVFGITEPFFVFGCRNKDLGMPPRRTAYQTAQQPPQIPQENGWQSQSDPWDNSDNTNA